MEGKSMSDTAFDLDERGALSVSALDGLRQRFVARIASDAKKMAKRAAKSRVELNVNGDDAVTDKPAEIKKRLKSEDVLQQQAADAEKIERYLNRAAGKWVRTDESRIVSAATHGTLDQLIRDVADPMPAHQKAKYAGYTGERGWGSFIWTSIRSPGNINRMMREKHFLKRDIHPDIFAEGESRIYMPLLEDFESDTQRRVTAVLEKAGYSEIDYIGGYAQDDRKNTVKIGKILTRMGEDRLMEQYNRDGARNRDKNIVVFSRHPEDIARCSTGRAWSSCMDANTNWNFDPYVLRDIKEGSMVAYLIKDSDPQIVDPLARILIKPMKNNMGEMIWQPEGLPYGLYSDIFKETVAQFTDRALNRGKVGEFTFINGLYRDSIRQQITRDGLTDPGLTTKQVLDRAGATYRKTDDGYVVTGNLDLSKKGFTELPDLSSVTVEGDLDLRHNKLKTLDNAPQVVTGALMLGGNNLTDLQGAPREVGELSAAECNLTSLRGSPEIVRGLFNVASNPLKSLADGPKEVRGEYRANGLQLDTLEGLEAKGITFLSVVGSGLTSMKGMPDDIDRVNAARNKLTSGEGLPAKQMTEIDVTHNPLESLEGFPQEVLGHVHLQNTRLTNLKGSLKRCTGALALDGVRTLTSLKGDVEEVGKLDVSETGLTDFEGRPEKIGTININYVNGIRLSGLQGFTGVLESPGGRIDGSHQAVQKILDDIQAGYDASAELATLKAATAGQAGVVATGYNGPAANEEQDNNQDRKSDQAPRAAGL
ncbi:MAG: hypothetical protein Alpg2KO_05540 [Alphaproteobacteria bacterium]